MLVFWGLCCIVLLFNCIGLTGFRDILVCLVRLVAETKMIASFVVLLVVVVVVVVMSAG